MVTTKTIYYNKGQINEVFRYAGRVIGGPMLCQTRNGITANAAVVKKSIQSDESRTLRRGDRVHSLPFTGQYIEQSPFSGSFKTIFRFTDGNVNHERFCGVDKAGYTYTHISDFGAFISETAMLPPSFGPGILNSLAESANTKALADLRRSYYSLGVILAERMETIGYITSKATQVTALLKARTKKDLAIYLRTRKADKRRIAKDLAGEHLGFVFGLLPLIDEIKGLADFLASDDSFVITGRGRQATVTNDMQMYDLVTYGASVYQWPYALNVQSKFKTKLSVRTSVSMKVDIQGFKTLRDHGLNPVATFYDIIPLSFLADFISNLSTYLRTYDPLLGVTFMTGNTTLWRELTRETTAKGIRRVHTQDGKNVTTSTGEGASFGRALHVERIPLTELPEAGLQFQNNLSLAKAATIASLTLQRAIKPVLAQKAIKDFRYRGPRPRYLPPIKYQR